MSREIKVSKASDASPKRFRKTARIDRHPTPASNDEFRNAIDTGIKNADARNVTPREIKDKTNIVNSWIKEAKNLPGSNDLAKNRERVHDTYNEYKWSKRFGAIA